MPDFDYWSWFRLCVKETGIAPSEFWKLDIVDMVNLYHTSDEKQSIDTSIMLNFERVLNGASKSWLRSNLSPLKVL